MEVNRYVNSVVLKKDGVVVAIAVPSGDANVRSYLVKIDGRVARQDTYVEFKEEGFMQPTNGKISKMRFIDGSSIYIQTHKDENNITHIERWSDKQRDWIPCNNNLKFINKIDGVWRECDENGVVFGAPAPVFA
jgi:hypothetical protein